MDLSCLRGSGDTVEDLSEAGATGDNGEGTGAAYAGWVYRSGAAGAGGRIYPAVSDCAADEPSLLFTIGSVGGGTDLRRRSVRRTGCAGDFSAERIAFYPAS